MEIQARLKVFCQTFETPILCDVSARSLLGDTNCDGALNGYDIDLFLAALTDSVACAAQFPCCPRELADMNCDGAVNGYNIVQSY